MNYKYIFLRKRNKITEICRHFISIVRLLLFYFLKPIIIINKENLVIGKYKTILR
jgi:hypothetical protein